MSEHQTHDPIDLLDELDSVIRAQEMLRQRVIALRARYRALEADASRYDKPGEHEWMHEEYGSVNVEAVQSRLEYAADSMEGPLLWTRSARECAAKVREYPRADRGEKWFETGQEWSR